MNALTKIALAAVVALPLHASAQSAELRVTGTITPSACTPSVDASVNYGSITRASLKDSAPTQLTAKTARLDISCGAAAVSAVNIKDQVPTSVVDGLTVDGNQGSVFGLGMSGGKAVGNYAITLSGAKDQKSGQSLNILTSSTADVDGFANPSSIKPVITGNYYAFTDGTKPGAYAKVSSTLTVTGAIRPASELPSGDVSLAGVAVVELVML